MYRRASYCKWLVHASSARSYQTTINCAYAWSARSALIWLRRVIPMLLYCFVLCNSFISFLNIYIHTSFPPSHQPNYHTIDRKALTDHLNPDDIRAILNLRYLGLNPQQSSGKSKSKSKGRIDKKMKVRISLNFVVNSMDLLVSKVTIIFIFIENRHDEGRAVNAAVMSPHDPDRDDSRWIPLPEQSSMWF